MEKVDGSIIIAAKIDPEGFEKGIEKMKKMSKDYESKVKTAITGAALAMGAAIVGFGASAVKTGIEFDAAMSQVAATMGTTVDEIQNLRDYALEMGAATAFSANEAAQALNYMALAGYDAETSMTMLPNVLNLAAAGGIDLAYASDMITDSQSALGLSLEKTSVLVDQMAKTASKSNTSVAQLGEAILTVGGTAKTLAGGTTELSTALGLLADNGIKGAEGGTALRNIILSLSAPTNQAAELMEALGVQVFDSAGNMRALDDIFADLNASMIGMTQGEQTEVLSTIFNKVDLKSANALLATSAERWNELSGAIDNAAGAAEAMASTQLDNLQGDITLMKSALEGLMIQISDGLTPALREIVQGLTKLIENFNIIGPIILGVATAIGVFAIAINFVTIVQKTTAAIAAFNAVLAANPVGIVVALIAGLVVAIVALWNTNEDFRNGVINIWNAIVNWFKQAWEDIKAFLVSFGEGIKRTWDQCTSWIKEALNKIVSFFQSAWAGVKNAWNNSVVGAYFNASWQTVKNIFSAVKSVLSGDFQGAWNAIKSIFSTWASFFLGIWNRLKEIFSPVAQFFTNAFNKAWVGVKNAFSSVTSFFKNLYNSIVNVFKNIGASFNSIGKNIVQGIWNGISNTTTWIKNKIRSWVGNVTNFLKNLFGIHSPSTLMRDEIGKYLAEGIGVGFEAQMPAELKAMSAAIDIKTITPAIAGGAIVPPKSAYSSVAQSINAGQIETLINKVAALGESASHAGSNYRFTAQLNRRTLFDELIEEAKLIQISSGRNPFELA